MADNNVYKWIVSLAIVISVMINFESVANGQKLSGKIDVAIMLAPYADGNGMYKRSLIKMVTDHLDMGDDKVRVVLINTGDASTDTNVLHSLSGDQGAIVQFLNEWNPTTTGGLHAIAAIQSCKWSECDFKAKMKMKNDRAKVVIFHAQYYKDDAEAGAKWAGYVRQMGAYIYIVNNPEKPGRFADWTGSPTRLFPMTKHERSETTSLKMPEIIKVIEKDLCGFCRFNAPGQQECGWKRFEADDPMYFGGDHAVCSSVESLSCKVEECEWACNQQWLWEKTGTELEFDCDQLECGPMRRNPVMPTSSNVENCMAEFDCGKPECPTTTSTTTSTIASTTSPTESSSTTTESKLTTAAAEKEVGGDKSAPSDSESFPVWAIGVIAVVAVLLLVAIIGFVVLKKRKATREKKEKMERAKRQEEIERMEMEKKRRATSRSKSVSAGKDASIGSKKSKGADASMLADISMATVAARQSKKPSSAACKIKSKPSLPVQIACLQTRIEGRRREAIIEETRSRRIEDDDGQIASTQRRVQIEIGRMRHQEEIGAVEDGIVVEGVEEEVIADVCDRSNRVLV